MDSGQSLLTDVIWVQHGGARIAKKWQLIGPNLVGARGEPFFMDDVTLAYWSFLIQWEDVDFWVMVFMTELSVLLATVTVQTIFSVSVFGLVLLTCFYCFFPC